ncbi:hypothetical protein FWF74_01050 [Candidatus Saccharibacteria bacterium]|nr:hypothetical protein [Candidatus Saccharibacteria bacterium]MCL1963226.1 hypothetical protein [Candidatus Saccharibacteria bacterium]
MELLGLVLVGLILVETTFLTVRKLQERRLKVARGSMLLDTSAIMDGRIVDVAKSGIITAEIIVPRSVVAEMQLLADKADSEKRARARKGLENVRELQRMETVGVTIINDGRVGSGGVDERLLELAKNYDASICTTDYNLNKVAKVVGATVVNVNELAQVLRAQYLPGEVIELQLTGSGANRDQAVGYLSDGTMVVVENAKNLIGQKINAEIVRSLQTEAGRMMFAEKVKSSAPAFKPKPAAVFHSDQLKKRRKFIPNDKFRNNPPKPLSNEEKMVQLANQSRPNNLH